MDLIDHWGNLHAEGWTLVKRAVEPDTATEWADRALASGGVRIDRDPGEPRDLDEGGPRHHEIRDAQTTLELLPELAGWYQASRLWLREILGREVICSPYPRSALTLKIYSEPGDCHGWHYDTNPVTALLILTETGPGYGTELDLLDGHAFLENDPGDCLVMLGRQIRHQAPPIPRGAVRVTVPANYYHPDDTWRPEGTDALVYGG